MTPPQLEISYTSSSNTGVEDMEIELETFKGAIDNAQERLETILHRVNEAERQFKVAKLPAQTIMTVGEQQKTLVEQNEALVKQNKILMKRVNAKTKRESTPESVKMFLRKRSELFTLYKEKKLPWYSTLSMGLELANPDHTPSIRIDSLIYTEGWREDDDLFERLFGVSPAETQEICKIDNDEVILFLDLHAHLQFCQGHIPNGDDEGEIKFRDFCHSLKESLSCGSTLPDFSDESTGVLFDHFEEAVLGYLHEQCRDFVPECFY